MLQVVCLSYIFFGVASDKIRTVNALRLKPDFQRKAIFIRLGAKVVTSDSQFKQTFVSL